MYVTIVGTNLPGRRFLSDGTLLDNVHVAVQLGKEAVDPVPGDADAATWRFEVEAVTAVAGIDLRGPAVQGPRNGRFFYLTWGDTKFDRRITMFRRAKLMVSDIDPGLVAEAAAGESGLHAHVDLTDERGGPRCARVHPPAVRWSIDRG